MDKSIVYRAAKMGFVSVGIGYKLVGGVILPEEAIVFGAPKKLPIEMLSTKQVPQASYDGIPSDVVEVGVLKAFQNTDRMRPAMGGCSVGHEGITAGTLGCVVWQEDKRLILSNNHVLANINDAEIGDAILQPGPFDDGTMADKIAELYDFVEIRFMNEESTCKYSRAEASILNARNALLKRKTRYAPIAHTTIKDAEFNLVDAALALPDNQADVSSEIIDVGHITGAVGGRLGMPIKKSGRTTGLTLSEIDQIDVTCQVQYGGGYFAVFEDQLLAGPMSQGGDSGSVVLDSENRVVGLLFAGSNSTTIINRWENVSEILDVSI